VKPVRDPSFLEKLALADRGGGRVEEWSEQPIQASELALVVTNLGNVLRTRKRHGSVLPDFGLGDYEDPRRVKESIDVLGREIQQAAARYEPRLQRPRVQAISRDQSRRIHYQLTGAIAGAPVKIAVVFDTIHRAVVSVVEG
jgi:type VI secretion system lysozyme-like protein